MTFNPNTPARLAAITTHGMSKTPEFQAWLEMKTRCYNPKKYGYRRYGGRGIKVCAEWLYDFAAFFAHVGLRPSPQHSLDRWPNNDGDYEPGNVRWATRDEQHSNTCANRYLTLDGETFTLSQWAKRLGRSKSGLRYLLDQGYTLEQALTEKIPSNAKPWTTEEESIVASSPLSAKELAVILGRTKTSVDVKRSRIVRSKSLT